MPEASRARAAAYVITASEGAALHLDRLRSRAADFDPDVRDRLIAGALIPAAIVTQAQKFRRWYRDAVLRLFHGGRCHPGSLSDALHVAPRIGQKTFVLDGRELPLRPNIGIYTQPVSFIGLPVVAVPVPLPGGLPIGVQASSPRRGARRRHCASPRHWEAAEASCAAPGRLRGNVTASGPGLVSACRWLYRCAGYSGDGMIIDRPFCRQSVVPLIGACLQTRWRPGTTCRGGIF